MNKLTLDTEDCVFFYEQEFYVLSNFSSFQVDWRSRRFSTSEHAYHWESFWCRQGEVHRAKILDARSAHEAFSYAQQFKADRRTNWDDIKTKVMRGIICEKALQNPYVFKKLMESGDRKLIENSWRDDFWGWGPNRDGQNKLGELWMDVRAEFRAELAAGS